MCDSGDKESIKCIMSFAFGMVRFVKLPDSAKDPVVFARVLKRVYSDLGSRLNNLRSIFDTQTAKIDWQRHGVYEWRLNSDGVVIHLVHKSSSTTVEVPDGYVVPANCQIQQNYSDNLANIVVLGTKATSSAKIASRFRC